jgi:SNF2 family DNA or RNA helicase
VEQATLYEAIVRAEMEAVENAESEMSRRGAVLRMLVRLKQVCNHPEQFLKEGGRLRGRSGKLDRLMEMLEEARENGERALVFTQYAQMGRLLDKHITKMLGEKILYLHGGTPSVERAAMIDRFQQEDGPFVFVLSLRAGGTGLNLTAATQVFHYDRWYNPAVEEQATDRAHRIGQTDIVEVHKFICLGTLEERIDELIERKKGIADQIIGGGESWLTELDSRELNELVMLREEALGD